MNWALLPVAVAGLSLPAVRHALLAAIAGGAAHLTGRARPPPIPASSPAGV
jgi:hypothetical protein